MENNYSYQFKDSDELGNVIWNYKDICSKNSLNNIWEGFEVADEYIIKNYGDPEKWDTSNVTKMDYLFYEIYEPIDFSKYDLSNWIQIKLGYVGVVDGEEDNYELWGFPFLNLNFRFD